MSLVVKQNIRRAMLSLILTSAFSSVAYSAAFANNDLTAATAGSVNAVVAGTGNIADALYNPAGLAWQEGVQGLFSNTSRNRFHSVNIAGVGYNANNNLAGRTSFALAWLPKGGNVGVAWSLSNPYDTRSNWSSAFPSLGFMDLEMSRYTLDGFWRVNNTLGVSLGADIYDTRLRLDTGGKSFSGSDWSDVGAHIGLRWEFMPLWTLGAHYRNGTTAKASNGAGDKVNIDLPTEWSIGIAHTLMDDEMLWELDVKRSNWSSLQNLDVISSGGNGQSNLANLRDTTDIMLGATWFWRHDTQLRFGYAYEQGANQAAGFQPLLSDSNGHKISIGFGGEMATMHLDMTLTGYIRNRMHAVGTYAGDYKDSGYNFLFSLSKRI